MSVSKFEDLVRDYAERQQKDETAEPVRRQTRIKWWQDRVGELVDDITQWLSPLVESGSLKIERGTAHLEEESPGHWVAHGRYCEPVHQIGSYPPVLVARHVYALYDALREIASYGKVMDFA